MTYDDQALLKVIDVHKDYEGKPLLEGVSLEARAGETLCLLGESGSGKSTLLRIIAGLEKPESGCVAWGGKDITAVPAHQRGFGLMFQDYALFPHLSVYENVAFGLRMRKLDDAEVDDRVTDALAQVQMAAFAQRGTRELSGGEQQRVALARTLAPRPGLIMLDEPLGALDRAMKAELLAELRELLHTTQIPAIYVTHDQEEAFSLADRLLILHGGRIIQGGAPEDVYQRPVNAWVARFLGQSNLVAGEVVSTNPLTIRTPLGILSGSEALRAEHKVGEPVVVLLRAASFEETAAAGGNRLEGVVEDTVFQGNDYMVVVRCAEGVRLSFHVVQAKERGDSVDFFVHPGDVLCLGE